MKKYILLLIMLAFIVSFLFADQEIIVRVYSNAPAIGTVFVGDEYCQIIDQTPWGSANFDIGFNEFSFMVDESYNPEYLWADACGGTSWGAWCETDWVQGFTGNPPTCNLTFSFSLPKDISVFVYSNIAVTDATIELQDQWQSYGTANEDLKKGWNEIKFNQVWGEMFNVTTCYAEVIAEGVGNEAYTLITVNDFVYNDETERYENYDIEFCFENKPLHSDWNWESFPKLTVNSTTNNGAMNFVPSLVNNIDPDEYDWLWLDGQNLNLEYEDDVWDPTFYVIWSTVGVKIKLDSTPERAYIADGTRVLANTEIELDEGWNWIGYWLPHSQMCDVVFGDDWDKVNIIRAEDWYYDDLSIIRGGVEPVTPQPKPFHYGEGYMIKMHEEVTLCLQTSEGRSENFDKPESQYFEYEVKADYEVIDVVNIDSTISEIGVFADGVCLGAVVVQDSSEQILVYSDNVIRDPLPFDFEVITGRGFFIPIKNYEVFNRFTGEFEHGIIISGRQEYSLIMLGEEGEQEDNTPSITKLHSNYPNPFNPSTTISFSVPQTSPFVTLKIFNIKGQKVKTLYSGIAEEGKHTVTWNGEDENYNPVSSGIYFYKLKTGKQELSRKMLLMK